MKTTGYRCDRCKGECNGHGIVANIKVTALFIDVIMVPLSAAGEMAQGDGEDKHLCGKECFMRDMSDLADTLIRNKEIAAPAARNDNKEKARNDIHPEEEPSSPRHCEERSDEAISKAAA